jgi:hypothetical protein
LGLVWTAPTDHPGATGFGRDPHGAIGGVMGPRDPQGEVAARPHSLHARMKQHARGLAIF